jgi:hypothetical protein
MLASCKIYVEEHAAMQGGYCSFVFTTFGRDLLFHKQSRHEKRSLLFGPVMNLAACKSRDVSTAFSGAGPPAVQTRNTYYVQQQRAGKCNNNFSIIALAKNVNIRHAIKP